MSENVLNNKLPDTAQRVADLLAAMGHDKPVVMLPETGKTSAEAAAGLGCSVAEIAKSIVFRRLSDDAAVMVVASGANRVDEKKVAAIVGELGKADAKFVKERIGYAIGGVCPIGHAQKTVMLIDEDLFKLQSVWAAAGHPHAVFNLTPQQLVAMTGAPVVDVALRTAGQSMTPINVDSAKDDDVVPSPCINVCRMHPQTGLCEGCFRTIEEIRNWKKSSNEYKRAVWAEIEKRQQELF